MAKLHKKIELASEEEVEEMIRSCDKIRCYRCGKEISLLDAKSIDGGMFFICKDGCEDLDDLEYDD